MYWLIFILFFGCFAIVRHWHSAIIYLQRYKMNAEYGEYSLQLI